MRARLTIHLSLVLAFLAAGCATTPPEGDSRPAQVKNKVILETQIVPKLLVAEDEKKPAKPEQEPPAAAAAAAPDSAKAAAPDGTVKPASPDTLVYRIGAGDVLNIDFLGDETLSGQVVVRYDGCISLPKIPVADIKIAGLSREEATARVQEAYGTVYKEPLVSVAVTQAASKTFTVTGDVTKAGEYPYTKPVTLLQAINVAGGLRQYTRGGDSYIGSQGQLVKAFIIHYEGIERQVREYDLRGFAKNGAHASDTVILPGDVVYVPESVNLVYVLGQVNRQSVFALSEGMTLLQLLANAGGFNMATTRMKGVVIVRDLNETSTKLMLVNCKEALHSGQDVRLEPGDIIYFPQKRLTHLRQIVVDATGTVSPVLSLAGQVMGLYTQAYDAYYAKDRFEQLFRQRGTSAAGALY